jgi:hypothetical protein
MSAIDASGNAGPKATGPVVSNSMEKTCRKPPALCALRRARSGNILERSGLRPWPPVRATRRLVRGEARQKIGRLELCHPMGQRRLLRPIDRAPRSPGARRRPSASRQGHGAIRELGHAACRAVHVLAQRNARRALSKIWLLRAFPHGHMSAKAVRQGATGWSRFSALSQAQREAVAFVLLVRHVHGWKFIRNPHAASAARGPRQQRQGCPD